MAASDRSSEGHQIKGAAIREFLLWYVRTYGQERLTRITNTLTPSLRKVFDASQPQLGVIASNWYPAPPIHALLDTMLVGLSHAEQAQLAKEGAEAIISNTLKGAYKWLFEMMMSPTRYARNAQKLFSRYYDAGTMTKEITSANSHLTVISDWKAHHPLLCEFIVHTGVYVYRSLGGKDVHSSRLRCVSRGDADCAFTVTWT